MQLAETFVYTLTTCMLQNIVVFLTAIYIRIGLLSAKRCNGPTLNLAFMHLHLYLFPCPQSNTECTKSFLHSFIQSLPCPTTVPQALSQLVLHRVRSSVSTFNFQQALLSLRSSSSCLLLPLGLSGTPTLFFHSKTCFVIVFLRQV